MPRFGGIRRLGLVLIDFGRDVKSLPVAAELDTRI